MEWIPPQLWWYVITVGMRDETRGGFETRPYNVVAVGMKDEDCWPVFKGAC